jgi:hypothetical protein
MRQRAARFRFEIVRRQALDELAIRPHDGK